MGSTDVAIDDEIGAEAAAFAEAVFDAFDPWQVVTPSEAAVAARVSEPVAKRLIARLKDAAAWPYRDPHWRKGMLATGRVGPFGPNKGDWGEKAATDSEGNS